MSCFLISLSIPSNTSLSCLLSLLILSLRSPCLVYVLTNHKPRCSSPAISLLLVHPLRILRPTPSLSTFPSPSAQHRHYRNAQTPPQIKVYSAPSGPAAPNTPTHGQHVPITKYTTLPGPAAPASTLTHVPAPARNRIHNVQVSREPRCLALRTQAWSGSAPCTHGHHCHCTATVFFLRGPMSRLTAPAYLVS